MANVYVPPQSRDAECIALGCALVDENQFKLVCEDLQEIDFYYSENQIIFSVLKDFHKNNKPADVFLVCQELRRLDKLDAVQGENYVVSLAQYAGTSCYVEEYIAIIHNKRMLRQLISSARELERRAIEEKEEPLMLLDNAQQLFFSLGNQGNQRGAKHVAYILQQPDFLAEIQQRQDYYQLHGKSIPKNSISTGFYDLDRKLGGLMPSNFVILAARPAMGKTAFAINVAENIAIQSKIPVAIFSLEMSKEQLINRVVSSQSGIEKIKMDTGDLSGEEYQEIVKAVKMLEETPLFIDDTPGLSISQIRARLRRLVETSGIGVVVIDYLQLITSSDKKSENRQNEVAEISRQLKNTARELNIPILCLAQLSRKVEERTNNRPMMSDLRESGSLEQDADQVIFIHRPEYYNPNSFPGVAELVISKNRHGEVGDVAVLFQKQLCKFVNRATYSEES